MNKDTIRIISAKSDTELELISELAERIWPEVYREMLSPEQITYMLEMMYSFHVMKRELDEDDMQFRIIYDDDKAIGFFAYSPYNGQADSIKLHKLYLDSAYRGCGIGSMALQYVINACADAGYKAIYLNVNKQNARAVKSYERNGFKLYKKAENDIGQGFIMDDFVMKRDL